MRFNDLLQTVLASDQKTGIGAITQWRQCVDMFAQYDRHGGASLGDDDRARLIERLTMLRPSLSEAQRVASVVELGRRLRSPALIEFFGQDSPSVCVAAMLRANLPDEAWPELMSRLSATGRGVLRSRKDMGDHARVALEQFGKNDLLLHDMATVATDNQAEDVIELTNVIETPVTESKAPASPRSEASDRSQIRELVDRIEKFTSITRARGEPSRPGAFEHPDEESPAPRHFPFETDSTGCIIWVGEASRAALVGLSIAEPAIPGCTGADGSIAGAFSRRSSFQHGRFWIGDGPYGGEWRLSAIPFFDQRSGRFQGYRGQARRPHIHEVPYPLHRETEPKESISFDSMRQIIHELRTPLNAILGFAEIIEQQLFGPAGVHYREMAGHILSDARRLLTAFDDLDLAARASAARQNAESKAEPVDVEPLLERVTADFAVSTDGHPGQAVPIRIATAAELPCILVDPVQAERMVQHLLRTLISVTGPDEVLHGSAWFQPDGDGGRVVIGFDRPLRLRGLEEGQLLDPGYGADGDWPDAPLLGLGFSLRLVRSLAQAQGGSMLIEAERFMLSLPVAIGSASGEAAHP